MAEAVPESRIRGIRNCGTARRCYFTERLLTRPETDKAAGPDWPIVAQRELPNAQKPSGDGIGRNQRSVWCDMGAGAQEERGRH